MDRKREIGARVRARREKAGRSVEWLADRLGIQSRSVLNIEAGITSITLQRAEQIAELLGCKLRDLSSVGVKNGKARATA